MGRLFWKFFFAFWLALLIAGVSVGTTVWLRHSADSHNQTPLDQHAGKFIQAAADIARLGGTAAFKQFLSDMDKSPLPTIYAVDADGQDILGRKVSAQLIAAAKQQLTTNDKNRAVAQVTSQEGQSFLLFAEFHRRLLLPGVLGPLKDMPPKPDLGPGFTPPGGPGPDFRPMHPPHPLPLILLIGSGLFAAILFSVLLAWYFTKPIKILRQAFAAVANGELTTRISKRMGHRHDELAELGRNFDHMAAQIDSLLSAQQRLLHDVSHELRSPLARMQAAIGLAQQQPDKMLQTLQRIERESKRIDDLVGELLILSRLETGANSKHYQEINLNQLLDEIVDDARFEAANKQLNIRCEQKAEVSINGDAELIHRALENVLRNAIRFTPEQGHIDVGLQHDHSQQQWVITIDDEGPGVAEHELNSIFEPFYHSQYAERNKGVGLGLAIALRAINSHGGIISAANRPQGGLHVEIRLPCRV